jgi:hypothetical protein
LLTLALVAGTVAIGWWGIPVVAFAWGLLAGGPAFRGEIIRFAASSATIAAIFAWGAILVWTAARGPLPVLITTVGQVAGAPGAILVLVTLLFPAVLAWSATTVGAAIGTRFGGAAGEASGRIG